MEQKYIKNGYSKFFDDILKRKEEEFQKQSEPKISDDENEDVTFIDFLYQKRNVFSQEEINDEVHTFILGVNFARFYSRNF